MAENKAEKIACKREVEQIDCYAVGLRKFIELANAELDNLYEGEPKNFHKLKAVWREIAARYEAFTTLGAFAFIFSRRKHVL